MLFPSLISVSVFSRWVMNLFPQLWAQLCLDEESYTCLASFPMVSKWKIIFIPLFYCIWNESSWQDMGLFSAQYIVRVDGRKGLFRGLSPRLVSNAISTVVRTKVKQVTKVEDFRYHDKLFANFILVLYYCIILMSSPTPHHHHLSLAACPLPTIGHKCICQRVICVFSSAGGISIQETWH